MGNTGARSDFSRYARIRDKYTERLMKFGRPIDPGNGDNRKMRRMRDALIRKSLKRNLRQAEQDFVDTYPEAAGGQVGDGAGAAALRGPAGGQSEGGPLAREAARREAGAEAALESPDDADAQLPGGGSQG